MASDRERQLDLLQIVCCVAWVDGDVSAEEKRLLEQLVARYFSSENGADASEEAARLLEAWTVDGTLLDELMARLSVAEDRLLALKLAYMMARVSQRPEDSAAINPQEKVLYRQLVEGLRLTEAEIQEAEWAAEQELSSGKGIWALLGRHSQGLALGPAMRCSKPRDAVALDAVALSEGCET